MQRRYQALLASTSRRLRSLAQDRSGGPTTEFAVVLPTMLLFIFGIIEVGHLMWTQTALVMAVEDASRCASVNSTICGNNGAIQTYAASRTWGMTIPASTFTVSQPACGYQVSASYPFTPIVAYIPFSITLTASSCFPAWSKATNP